MKNDEANTRTEPFIRVNEDPRFLAYEAMKREESIMAKEKKIIPIAERHIDFPSDCNIQYSAGGAYDADDFSKEKFDEVVSKSLLFSDGQYMTHYMDEYPIVLYQCDESACFEMDPEYRLNSFVKSIHLSIADAGKRYCLTSGNSVESRYVGQDVIAYYEDNYGNLKLIEQDKIITFLFQKPELVVSPEGVLVFYTDREMLVTLDMEHYSWIDDIPEEAYDGVDTPSIRDGRVDEEELTIDIGMSRYQLDFFFDFTELNPIKYTFNKVE